MGIYILYGIGAVFVLLFLHYSNKLTTNKNQVEDAFSAIDRLFLKRETRLKHLIEIAERYNEGDVELYAKVRLLYQGDVESFNPSDERAGLAALSQLMAMLEQNSEVQTLNPYPKIKADLKQMSRALPNSFCFLNESISRYNQQLSKMPYRLLVSIMGCRYIHFEASYI